MISNKLDSYVAKWLLTSFFVGEPLHVYVCMNVCVFSFIPFYYLLLANCVGECDQDKIKDGVDGLCVVLLAIHDPGPNSSNVSYEFEFLPGVEPLWKGEEMNYAFVHVGTYMYMYITRVVSIIRIQSMYIYTDQINKRLYFVDAVAPLGCYYMYMYRQYLTSVRQYSTSVRQYLTSVRQYLASVRSLLHVNYI